MVAQRISPRRTDDELIVDVPEAGRLGRQDDRLVEAILGEQRAVPFGVPAAGVGPRAR